MPERHRGVYPALAVAHVMLVEWRDEILNYFDTKLTNGFVESNNNRTEVIQPQSYGYGNLAILRLRIRLTQRA